MLQQVAKCLPHYKLCIKKKENVGVLGRLSFWHLSSSQAFIPPQQVKIIHDIASIDHLLIIAHELFQYSPEFRFQKHASDVAKKHVIGKMHINLFMGIRF